MAPFLRNSISRPERILALRRQAAAQGRKARTSLLILLPLVVALLVLEHERRTLFGSDLPVRLAAAISLAVLGIGFARQLGRYVQPKLLSRLEPTTAAIVGFLIRLATAITMIVVALSVAGLRPSTITLGASFTAIIFGLAAQQTIGNVFAGIVLLAARPFSVGDRVRFNGFGMDVEGTVAGHGLLYVNCHDGHDLVLIPNNTALTMSVRPIREPAGVNLVARLPKEADPEAVQRRVAETVDLPLERPPQISLEEFDGDEVVMRIKAAPSDPSDGASLARQVLRTVDDIAAAVA